MGTCKRANPADERRTSYIVLHWATGITKALLDSEEYDGYEPAEVLQIGFAMANAMAEKQGLRVPGTNELTPAGKKREREMLKHRPAEQIEAAYAALAKDTRHNYSANDLDRALAGDKNLSGAELVDANLIGVDLRRAKLMDAILYDANLYGADLRGADLSGARLMDAILHDAKLNGAILDGASFFDTDLRGANLTGASLRDVELQYVRYDESTIWPSSARDVLRLWRGDKNLRRAKLMHAILYKADLTGADLRGADLTGAILDGASFFDTDLRGAKLHDADLTGAKLMGAKLHDADLTGAYLTGAELTGAELSGAILDNITYDHSTVWPEGFKPPQKERYLKRAYGVMTGPVLKFGKPDVAYKAQNFKRRYPQEFDLLKRKTGVTDFSQQFAENLRQTSITPYDWIVTHRKYISKLQRVCPAPNFVLLLNVDLDAERFTEQQKNTLHGLTETSRHSKHPYEPNPLFTVGWVRICRDDDKGVWLVEEVQSDLQVAGRQKNDERLGSARERLDEIMEIMQPYVDRFYQDALGITLIEAEKLGYEVEMLTHETKARIGANPPRDVYKDLPLSMGISAKRKSKALPDLPEEVRWTRPNPPKRR